MQVTKISVESNFGITIQNQFILAEPRSNKLLAILPGRGYTVDNPGLYYLGLAGTELGYDVLGIKYGFHLTQADLNLSNFAFIHEDGANAIHAAVERGYDEICVVGKSMGTPIAVSVAEELDIPSKKLILLTPIQDSHKMVQTIPTLCVIGTQDRFYQGLNAENTDLVTWKIYEGLDHALEYPGNWRDSIIVMQDIVKTCVNFLETNL